MIVDASVWVSAFLPADTHHGEVLAFLRRTFERGESVELPNLALAEIGGAIARRTGDAALAAGVLALVRRQPLLTIHALDDSLGEAAARLAIDARLRGADAVCVALAARLDATLVTLDREMMERGAATARIVMPDAV
jgi:predicted nucleic acid-binding protein